MYAVILAGGGGTRLWPLSRPEKPKPFLPLIGDRTLLQRTWDRVVPGLVGAADVAVVTDVRYAGLVRDQLPDLRDEMLLEEPVGRNTAAALAFAAAAVDRPEDEVMLVLPADHLVADEPAFRAILRQAADVAAAMPPDRGPGRLVTLGIAADGPETGYGYIVAGRRDRRARSGGRRRAVRREAIGRRGRRDARRAPRRSPGTPGSSCGGVMRSGPPSRRGRPTSSGPSNVACPVARRDSRPPMRPSGRHRSTMPCSSRLPLPGGWRCCGRPSAGAISGAGARCGTPLRDAGADPGVVGRGPRTDLGSERTLVIASDRPVVTIGLRDVIVVDAGDVILVAAAEASQQVKAAAEQWAAAGSADALSDREVRPSVGKSEADRDVAIGVDP